MSNNAFPELGFLRWQPAHDYLRAGPSGVQMQRTIDRRMRRSWTQTSLRVRVFVQRAN